MAEKDKVSLTLHHEVITAIDNEAHKQGRSRSGLIDYILRQWMVRKRAQATGSRNER